MKKLTSLIVIIVMSFSLQMGCTKKDIKVSSSTKPTNTAIIDKTETSVPGESKADEKKEITERVALERVEKTIGDIAKGFTLEFDHMDKRDGRDYFVIHFYETVIDNPDTGEGHRATVAWYYVEKSNGDVYEWDIIEDKINKVSPSKQ
jgi:hypothetical protein